MIDLDPHSVGVDSAVWTTRLQNIQTRGDQMREPWNVQDWDVRY